MQRIPTSRINNYRLLQLSLIALLLGRAWQFISLPTPFSAFLYHPKFTPVLENIYQTNWKDYLTNPYWDELYDRIIEGVGIYFLLFIVGVIFLSKIPHWVSQLNLWLVFGILFFLAFCYSLDKGLAIGQWIEYSSQFGTPVLLVFWLKYGEEWEDSMAGWYVLLIKILVAMTFIGHALYAIGYYPVPGHFVDMVIKGFGVNEPQARTFLTIVGYLDIVAAIALFIPLGKLQRYALMYIIIWAFLTALARIYTNYNPGLGWYSLKQWLPHFLMRMPHFIIPILLWNDKIFKKV